MRRMWPGMYPTALFPPDEIAQAARSDSGRGTRAANGLMREDYRSPRG
jgi:hypothetical protein